MKYIVSLLVASAFVIAGCGGTGVAKQAANPQVRADLHQAEGIAKACLLKSHTPKGFAACAAPKGHTAALEACAVKAITSDLPLHKKRLTPALAECVVKNR